MIRLSIPFRQALSRLTLPVMLVFSLGCVLIGRADQHLSDRLRSALDDLLAPAYMLVSGPIQAVEHSTGAIGHLFELSQENAQLRAQNKELLQWQEVAMALQAQNDALKASLHFVPPPTPHFSTGEVVADLGGVYARSVLVLVPPSNGDPQTLLGAVAMDGRGLAGRVVDAGSRSARVLLITDINSRIPVAIGANGEPALMVGNNGPDPSLLYWSPSQPPAEGAMVLTSAEGGAFAPGLPVGVVHYNAQNQPVVLPLAHLSALRILRLFSYPDNLPDLTPIPHKKPDASSIRHHRKH
ncbi:rod shape-determining protein MreC [Acidocella aminolytica]|uniref:Cell shape-determining protein MreC n=1 Tax=Acidocella aminolytica 101 = DSM 11237 TaxID=1120923 RepID=A0A0D6PFL1_9PROT|nr:rod shape-determining protein MreC [Acidocella aminolytica]GAN80003.1 rod shape-determining protein MreC [Acidocella aminolytica 101 = DSM 11237]GBQ40515.1 rod shape-determining protein MreC [Acidocella aminolytica 101 = DSM 11237]SHF08907.1 rod shape-determining protein MreC [Acidocella aminolytica 101 = DSM 11237]